MKATLEAINQMQADGVIGKYAIGGAVGATLYLEPAATFDVDIFVVLPTAPSGVLISLAPIYDYLTARGYATQGEHIVIHGWPVQFLPANDGLDVEALNESAQTMVDGVTTWVLSPEHLVAIALRTGRPKDQIRVLQFIRQEAVDRNKLQRVIESYNLSSKWCDFENRYLKGTHE